MISITLKILSVFIMAISICKGNPVQNQNLISNGDQWATPNETFNYFIEGQLERFLWPNQRDSSGSLEDESSQIESLTSNEDDNTEIISEEIVHPHVMPLSNGAPEETPRTVDREASMREQEIMKHILKALNLTRPPKVSAEDKIPSDFPLVRDIERNERNEERFAPYMENIRGETRSKKLISVAKKSPFMNANAEGYFYFNLTSENRPRFSTKGATLKYYIKPRNFSVNYVTVHYDIIRKRSSNPRHSMAMKSINISTSEIVRNQGWLSLSFKALDGHVQMWLEKPERNLGIRLYSSNVPDAIGTSNGKKPYVEIEFHKRAKRNVEDELEYCPVNSDRNDCCLNNFTINFQDVGWDWIIYPQFYQANYCAGHCSRIQHEQSSHKMLVEIQANKTNNTLIPKTCCVPKEYATVSLLYYDDNSNIIYSTVPDMKVMRCGCA